MTSLSQRKGPMSSAASHAGGEVRMRIATTSPTTPRTAKIPFVTEDFHVPVTKGRTAPRRMSASTMNGTTGAAKVRIAVTMWSSGIVEVPAIVIGTKNMTMPMAL